MNDNNRKQTESSDTHSFNTHLKLTNLKRYTHTHIHCSIILNHQDMEATYVSTDRWMDKMRYV